MENKYLDRAKALREDPNVHYNCAQAVTATFADECGMTREAGDSAGGALRRRHEDGRHLRRDHRRADGHWAAGRRGPRTIVPL